MPFGPTPDLNRMTVAWAGVNTDGSPCTGRIILQYQGPVMLDDSDVMPISVYPSKLVMELTARTLVLNQDSGTENQVVGYAEAQVPASNDPDLLGSGGAYLLTEDLDDGNGVPPRLVVIDVDFTGTIWLNRLTATGLEPGTAPIYVSTAEIGGIQREASRQAAQIALLEGSINDLANGYVTDEELAQQFSTIPVVDPDDIVSRVEADLDDWPDLALIVQAALI